MTRSHISIMLSNTKWNVVSLIKCSNYNHEGNINHIFLQNMQIRLLHQNILCWIAAFSEMEKYVALFMSEIMFDASFVSFEQNKMQFEDWYRPYIYISIYISNTAQTRCRY